MFHLLVIFVHCTAVVGSIHSGPVALDVWLDRTCGTRTPLLQHPTNGLPTRAFPRMLVSPATIQQFKALRLVEFAVLIQRCLQACLDDVRTWKVTGNPTFLQKALSAGLDTSTTVDDKLGNPLHVAAHQSYLEVLVSSHCLLRLPRSPDNLACFDQVPSLISCCN